MHPRESEGGHLSKPSVSKMVNDSTVDSARNKSLTAGGMCECRVGCSTLTRACGIYHIGLTAYPVKYLYAVQSQQRGFLSAGDKSTHPPHLSTCRKVNLMG